MLGPKHVSNPDSVIKEVLTPSNFSSSSPYSVLEIFHNVSFSFQAVGGKRCNKEKSVEPEEKKEKKEKPVEPMRSDDEGYAAVDRVIGAWC